MVWFAFSIQDQVDKYGTYVGFAAFVGLAILSVLYASQAREVKRLREWAGRAPERAAEVEAQAIANAEAARREPAPPIAPRVVAQPRAAEAGSPAGAGGAVPARAAAEAAASAFAPAGGVTTALVHPPAAEEAEPDGSVPAPAATNGAGPGEAAAPAAVPETGEEPVLPASTSAARRAQQPAEPTAATLASRTAASRPAPAAPAAVRAPDGPDDTLTAPGRSVAGWIVLGIVGVVVVAAAVFAGTQLFGGGGSGSGTQTGDTGGGGATATATSTATPAPTPDDAQTRVVVLNATSVSRLAATTKAQLLEGDFRSNHVAAANLTVASPQETSNVYYINARDRARAQAVAKTLGINGTTQANGTVVTRAGGAYTEDNGTDGQPQVIVVVGTDKAR